MNKKSTFNNEFFIQRCQISKNKPELYKNVNEKRFANALRIFFTLPKEEISKIWKTSNIPIIFSHDLTQQHDTESLQKIFDYLTEENIIDEDKYHRVFADATETISKSTKFHFELASRIPYITYKNLNINKMKSFEELKKLLTKDYPLYVKKTRGKNIQLLSCKNEFIIQWFKPGHEYKYESLRSFSNVFQDIENLSITKEFLNWLKKHPEIEPPPCLLEKKISENNVSTSEMENNSIPSLEINQEYIENYFKNINSSYASTSMETLLDIFTVDIPNFI